MGWVQEIKDILEKLKFAEIIDEGQVGIYLHNGEVIPRKIKWKRKDLEEIASEEKQVIKDAGGYSSFMPFLKRPKLPEGYGFSKLTGLPVHPKRYKTDKDLAPGLYFLWPLIDSIYADHNQERAIFSKPENMVIVPTTDKMNIGLGYVMIQKIEDYYRAYSKGDDYEDLLRVQASSIVAKLSSGKSSQEWLAPQLYKEIADSTLEKLRKFTNNRWGIGVSEFALTPIILNPNLIITSNVNQQNGIYLNNPQNGNSARAGS